MIELYAKGTTSFLKHGIALAAQQASVTYQDNGRYDMDMVMPYNPQITIDYGMILRCPVPKQTIPQITLGTISYWEISAGEADVPLYKTVPVTQTIRYGNWSYGADYAAGSKVSYDNKNYQANINITGITTTGAPPSFPNAWGQIPRTTTTGGEVLVNLQAGDQIIKTGDFNDTYMKVADTAGHEGFIRISKCTDMSETGTRTVPEQHIENQSFVITEITKSSDKKMISLHAEHISYQLQRTLLGDCNISRANPATALMFIRGAMTEGYPGEIETNLSDELTVTGDYSWKNAQAAIMDPKSGILQATNGRFIRNDLNVYIITDDQTAPAYRITYGVNMKAVTWDGNIADLVTRIYPIAQTAAGDTLLLPEKYIDTVRTVPYIRPEALNTGLKVGAKEKQEDGSEIELDEDTVYARMREQAGNRFNIDECDKATVTLEVDWQHLPDTAEYSQYAALANAAPGEWVKVTNGPMGIDQEIQMTGYTFDPIMMRYNKGTFGKKKAGGTVPGYSLKTGSVTGRALASGAVNGSNIQAGAITAREIEANSITSDKIASKSITTEFLAANCITAEEISALAVTAAKIAAGAVTADKIEAGAVTAVKIAADAITATKIAASDISAINAKLGTATITNGMIDNANISYARIMDASVNSLIAKDAVADTYYIDKLQVRNAQMVTATVGELIVKASDNHYYRLDFDGTQITPTDVTNTLLPAEITAGVTSDGYSTIIETDLAVADLSASNMKAINALIDKLTASRIDVYELWARQAFINQLMVTDISSNTYIQSTIGNWQSGSTITQTINSLDSRISSLGYGTIFMQPEEPDHAELVPGDIWIQTQPSGTWEQVYQDYATWQDIYNNVSTWQTLGGIPIMWAWDGRKWQKQMDNLDSDTFETEIQQNAQQIALLATQMSEKYTIRSGITITAAGIDISGAQYVKIASGGVFSVQTGNFGIDSESATYVIWAGNASAASAPFWVKKDGTVYATSGTIGGWNLAANSLNSGSGSTYTNINSNASNTYVMWSGAEVVTNAPFRIKRDGTVYLTSLIALDENNQETTVNLRTAGLWKLSYRTVKSFTARDNGGTITLTLGCAGGDLSVNFNNAASGYADGWNAAYAMMEFIGATKYLTVRYPSSVVDTQTYITYTLDADNSSVYLKGGGATVASMSNPAYGNAWTAAYNCFGNTMSGANLTVTVPAASPNTTRNINYTVAGLTPYSRAGQTAYTYQGGTLVSFTIPGDCKTGSPYITTA